MQLYRLEKFFEKKWPVMSTIANINAQMETFCCAVAFETIYMNRQSTE